MITILQFQPVIFVHLNEIPPTCPTMNLADPELELLDPTPNVHAMFLNFDRTFFWDKLSSRCVVRWSKRMYSCAGVCSYEGKGGLCDIALSEPLLKLRPRKDLVETLLHEMIHAFLFITSQILDRDAHGPSFQAHMHRINRAAGLNISIYHDFHDEVRLYLTHWWRCNGPCQTMRPHFGIIRRSSNRAPGPNDYWWDSHQRYCGGTFIKIKAPEKPNKSKKAIVPKPNGDITKYINNNNNKEVNNKNTDQQHKPNRPALKDSSNVPVKPNVGIKNNNSSTVVVNKKNVIFNPQVQKPKPPVFSGSGQKINGEQKRVNVVGNVNDVVRSVWTRKKPSSIKIWEIKDDPTPTTPTNSKHKSVKPIETPPSKMKKIDEYFKSTASTMLKDLYGQDFNVKQSEDKKLIVVPKKTDAVDCPVCECKINRSEINQHLDECLNKSIIEKLTTKSEYTSTPKSSPVHKPRSTQSDGKKVKEENVASAVHKQPMESGTTNTKPDNVTNRKRPWTAIYENNTAAVNKIIQNGKVIQSDSYVVPNVPEVVKTTLENKPEVIAPPIKIEPGCSKTDFKQETQCPCCGHKLDKPVEEHLDECLCYLDNDEILLQGGSTNRTNEVIVIDDDLDQFDETLTMNDTGTKWPCPCCLNMVEEMEMNAHLDTCLI